MGDGQVRVNEQKNNIMMAKRETEDAGEIFVV